MVIAEESGVLIGIDREALVRLAAEADCSCGWRWRWARSSRQARPLAAVEGGGRDLDIVGVRRALTFGLERTLDEDVAYGFRMLVDMAERALSEGPFLDPTTAVQAIDRLHDGLRQLAQRRLPDGRHFDARRAAAWWCRPWAGTTTSTSRSTRSGMAGAASPQVSRRLLAALDDLLAVAPRERRPALEDQRELLTLAVIGLDRDRRDRAIAMNSDEQGLGATVDGSIVAARR